MRSGGSRSVALRRRLLLLLLLTADVASTLARIKGIICVCREDVCAGVFVVVVVGAVVDMRMASPHARKTRAKTPP